MGKQLFLLILTSSVWLEASTFAQNALTANVLPVQTPKARVQVTDIWVTFKTHCDVGFTDTIEGVLRQYRVTMMDHALGIIDQDRQLPPEQRFTWMLPGWMLHYILGPDQEISRKKRIEQAVREGALAPGAIPFSLHSETEELEDLVRGLGFSSTVCREYCRPLPLAAKMTDVPCHSWVWPTLLSHAGVKFLQIGANVYVQQARVPLLFWWEGPDGSRILCNYSRRYGSLLIPPKGWPAANYLAVIMTGDNRGPPTPEDVARIRGEAARRMPGVRVHFGSLDDFTRALVTENPDLPVIRGDMPDTWIHGWMSMPIEAKTVRTIRPLQPTLDLLDTQLRLWGRVTSNVAPELALAYELSNLYSEHTFGPCYPDAGSWNSHTPRNQYGAAWKTAHDRGSYKAYEGVFNNKRAYAHKEADIVTRELSARLDLLARSVAVEGKRTVVYNGLPWPRSGVVEVEGKLAWVEDVPANGYKTLAGEPLTLTLSRKGRGDTATLPLPVEGEAGSALAGPGEGVSFVSPFYRVAFDLKRGGIASLIEKKTGRELVDQTSPYALGQFLHERFDRQRVVAFTKAYAKGYPDIFANTAMPSDVSYAALTPPAWALAVRRCDVADIMTLTASNTLGLAKGIAIVITLNRHQPSVEIEWRVTDKTPDPIPEGGWLCFPFAIAQPQFTLGRLGGPIDPVRDIVDGANRHLICLSSGLTISGNDGAGIGLCPLDSPCVSLGELGLNKFSLDYIPKKSAVFVNLYNNVWRTNFPQWQDGSWASRVRLWPTSAPAENGLNLIVPAWEARLPLLTAVADGPAGLLPREQSGVSVSRKGVLVTAFGQNPDGAGTVLRVWEQAGQGGALTVTLPAGAAFTKATPVNLRGEKAGALLNITDNRLNFDLEKYAPASFVLE